MIKWSSTQLQMPESRPLAVIDHFLDRRARTRKERSSASAAASKAGPRFAEVAGRLMLNARIFEWINSREGINSRPHEAARSQLQPWVLRSEAHAAAASMTCSQ